MRIAKEVAPYFKCRNCELTVFGIPSKRPRLSGYRTVPARLAEKLAANENEAANGEA